MKIQSRNVWIDEAFRPAIIEFDRTIKAIKNWGEEDVDIDYGDLWILPGFIDIHTHGSLSVSANNPSFEKLDKWSNYLVKEGVTSFLLTTSSQADEKNEKALPILADYCLKEQEGSEALGINIEGNFISLLCPGAQDKSGIIGPNVAILEKYNTLAKGQIKTVTYACEEDKDFTFLDYCLKHDIVASIGHSAANFKEAQMAALKGAKAVTHVGNGMRQFHHRSPNLFGAALNIDSLYAECIADGFHLDFETVHLIGMMKGKDKFILVSDSAVEKNDPKFDHLKKDGAYKLEDGTLYGSALMINKGVNNLINKAHLPLVTAINSTTINPAKYLKVDDRKGSLAVNKDSDIIVCDTEMELKAVYCRGLARN